MSCKNYDCNFDIRIESSTIKYQKFIDIESIIKSLIKYTQPIISYSKNLSFNSEFSWWESNFGFSCFFSSLSSFEFS